MNTTRYETINENHVDQLSKHKPMCEIPLLPWKLVILKQKEIYVVGVKIGSLIQSRSNSFMRVVIRNEYNLQKPLSKYTKGNMIYA